MDFIEALRASLERVKAWAVDHGLNPYPSDGNIFPSSPSAWSQGYINTNTGDVVNSSVTIVTDYISIKDVIKLNFKKNPEKTVRIAISLYRLENGNYTRVTGTGWKTDDFYVDIAKYAPIDAIRIEGSHLGDDSTPTNITPNDVINLYAGVSLIVECETIEDVEDDTPLNIVQSAGDSESDVMSQKATTKFTTQLAKNVSLSAKMCGNILPMSPDEWEQGSIDNTGNNVSGGTRIRTGYIDAKHLGKLNFKNNAEKTAVIEIHYYNLEGSNYVRKAGSGWRTNDFVADASTYDAIRIVGRNVANTAITPYDVINLYAGASLTSDLGNVVDKDDIRIMQYNIGRYNYGVSGGLEDDKIPEKIANYKRFFGEYRPDIVCLQEYQQYIDGDRESVSANDVLFGELFPYLPASHYYDIFRSSLPFVDYYRKTFSNGDGYTLAIFNIKNKIFAILMSALRYNDASVRASQFNEAMQILSNYDYAIFSADMNFADQEEMNSLLQIASENGFKACNGGFFGTFDTIKSSLYFKPIDNILVKGDVIIRNVIVPDAYDKLSSDHYPLIADIRIK